MRSKRRSWQGLKHSKLAIRKLKRTHTKSLKKNVPHLNVGSTKVGAVRVLGNIAIGRDAIALIAQTVAARGRASHLLESTPTKRSTMSLLTAVTRRKGAIGMREKSQGPDHLQTDIIEITRRTKRKSRSINVIVARADLLLKTLGSTVVDTRIKKIQTRRSPATRVSRRLRKGLRRKMNLSMKTVVLTIWRKVCSNFRKMENHLRHSD